MPIDGQPQAATWQVEPLRQKTLGHRLTTWNVLWRTLPLPHPMLHGSFIDVLLRHWGTGNEWLCTLGDRDDPQGMCILCCNGYGRWSTFLPMQSQVGAALLYELDDVNGLLPALPGTAVMLDLLAIDPHVMPVDLALHRPLDVMPHTFTLGVQLQSGFKNWWQARPKKLRDNIKRHQAELARCFGHTEVRWIEDHTELCLALQRYAELESEGWKAAGGTAVALNSDQLAFYLDLAASSSGDIASNGQMVVTELWGNTELLASRVLWASPEGDVVALKTTYAEQHKAVSPGRLLLHDTLHLAHQRWPGRRFELCTDAAADLAAWADLPRHTLHLSLYRNGAMRAMRHALQTVLCSINPPSAEAAEAMRSPSLDCRVYRQLQALPATAQRLLRKGESESLQLGANWLQALEDNVFGPAAPPQNAGSQALYAVLTHGDAALAVWPLAVHQSGPLQLESMANYYCAITGPVLQPWCKPQQFAMLVRHLADTLPQAQVLRLQPLDPNRHATHVLRAALRMAGYGVFSFFAFHNWSWRGKADWAEYLTQRSSKLRSNIKRATKRITEAGGRIEIITQPADVGRGMAAYEAVYARSWKQPEPFPQFFRDVAAVCAPRGQLRLGVAWLGDKPIAAQFWIVAHGVAEIHKLAYDEAEKELGAGTALSGALFEYVLNTDRVHTIDYLIGGDAYKAQWMNLRGQRWGLVAGFARSPRGAWLLGAESMRRLGKWLLRPRAGTTTPPRSKSSPKD